MVHSGVLEECRYIILGHGPGGYNTTSGSGLVIILILYMEAIFKIISIIPPQNTYNYIMSSLVPYIPYFMGFIRMFWTKIR